MRMLQRKETGEQNRNTNAAKEGEERVEEDMKNNAAEEEREKQLYRTEI